MFNEHRRTTNYAIACLGAAGDCAVIVRESCPVSDGTVRNHDVVRSSKCRGASMHFKRVSLTKRNRRIWFSLGTSELSVLCDASAYAVVSAGNRVVMGDK